MRILPLKPTLSLGEARGDSPEDKRLLFHQIDVVFGQPSLGKANAGAIELNFIANEPCSEYAGGPSWNIESEYSSFQSPEIERDVAQLVARIEGLERTVSELARTNEVGVACNAYRKLQSAKETLSNLSIYTQFALSVDAQDGAALNFRGRLQSLRSQVEALEQSWIAFIQEAEEAEIASFLEPEDIEPARVRVQRLRAQRAEKLSAAEESLLAGFAARGFHPWEELHTTLAGNLQCKVKQSGEVKTLGLAQASSRLFDPEERVRRDAFHAINDAWRAHETTCATCLNQIAGWRIEESVRRSHTRPVDVIDGALRQNKIERATLEALMAAVEEAARPLAQKAVRLRARLLEKHVADPWDRLAPAPRLGTRSTNVAIPYEEAIGLIERAFSEVDESIGEFVRMMDAESWIEGTQGANKSPGAYCGNFTTSKTPRVFMTYSGSTKDVITLAHELGHAYHYWLIRGLPTEYQDFGMSLAETASTFGEAIVRESLLAQSTSKQERLDMMWEEMAAIETYLLSVPALYDFDLSFYERRKERPLQPDEFSQLTRDIWGRWYGDTLSEADDMFWASKAHPYFTDVSFYNFPYAFGYLFSYGVFLLRTEKGDEFFDIFRALLQDTGRMSAEDLAQKHLGVCLQSQEFWQSVIAALTERVDAFEDLVTDAMTPRN